ncbi:MAG: hypothetical protein QME96_01475 [Myxococcota bacterium]|nr:hypothetical protein [Myxococcota bacterium]
MTVETAFIQPIGTRIRQGDILAGLELYEVTDIRADGDGNPVFSGRSVRRGLAVVVTQDCDLEWDFNAAPIGRGRGRGLGRVHGMAPQLMADVQVT